MVSKEELRKLFEDVESDRVERTTSLKNMKKACENICAFSNDMPNHRLPGYYVVGVNDDGSIANLSIGDELLKDLAAQRDNGTILPIPTMTVHRFSYPEGDVAFIEVQPHSIPPVRYDGRVIIRVGPTCRIATREEERMLAERAGQAMRTFDSTACPGSKISDLNLDIFKTTYLPQAIAPEILKENYSSNAPVRFYWFSDHLEIQNPGGLFGSARPENFPNQNDYRNPILAEALKTLGFVNRFSRGVIRSKRLLEENGNGAPIFIVNHLTYFNVSINKRHDV